MAVHNGTGRQLVMGAAIRTVHRAGFGYIQKHARVHAPERRARTGAMQREVGGTDLRRRLIFARGRSLRHRESQKIVNRS